MDANLQSLLERVSLDAIERLLFVACLSQGRWQAASTWDPTFEDKLVQRAVVMLLEPIYEQTFYDCSFGFRPGYSAHQALQSLRNHIMDDGEGVLDVDMQYFDTIEHTQLRNFRPTSDGWRYS